MNDKDIERIKRINAKNIHLMKGKFSLGNENAFICAMKKTKNKKHFGTHTRNNIQ